MKTFTTQSKHFARTQRGAALFIALVALISMSLAAIALVRSVDTTNQIAGNFAFRQAALHITDVGTGKAIEYLLAIPGAQLEKNAYCEGTSGPICYYALQQVTDSFGIPKDVDWSPKVAVQGDYYYQFVIDRMCQLPPTSSGKTIPRVNVDCHGQQGSAHYRITVQVNGPRNTNSIVQLIYRRPISN